MSASDYFDAEAEAARAGRLGCACPEDAPRALRRALGIGRLAGGFALVVLAQALTLGALPLAGAMLAPRPELGALPLAAFLLGAALASLPASFLLDTFGRRAAFALGASLGVAGGLVAAYAMALGAFPMLVLGAAWLGAAQGFGMFYRHAAAFGAASGLRAGMVARLLGAGALAGLVGPLLAGAAEAALTPYTFAGTLILAALAQLGALGFAVSLPEARFSHADLTVEAMAQPQERPAPLAWRALVLPTLIGALAWAAMTSAMAGAPLSLAGCGVGVPLISGVVAWHVVAMYAPALAGGALARWIGAAPLALLALALCLGAAVAVAQASEAVTISLAFLAVGAGWALASLATTLMLHGAGTPSRPSRLQLGVHDGLLLAAALAGVLV